MRVFNIAAYPAIDAEVDEGGERPDFFLFNEFAVEAGGDGHGQVEGQGQVFVVQHGGQREERASDHGGDRSEQDAEDYGGLKGDVGGIEVGDGEADPDAEAEGNADEGQQAERLRGAALGGKEQILEGPRPGQRAGDGSGDTKLYQQRDQD